MCILFCMAIKLSLWSFLDRYLNYKQLYLCILSVVFVSCIVPLMIVVVHDKMS